LQKVFPGGFKNTHCTCKGFLIGAAAGDQSEVITGESLPARPEIDLNQLGIIYGFQPGVRKIEFKNPAIIEPSGRHYMRSLLAQAEAMAEAGARENDVIATS
jgi:hypothetical protein